MSKLSQIPQYGLHDDNGNPVSFHVMNWGNKKQNYDFEKPHRHNFNEVLVFSKGGGTHDIDFTTYEAHNNSIHFVAADNVHLVLTGKKAVGCSLLFAYDYLNRELIARLPFSKTDPVLRLSKSDFNLITPAVENIKKEHGEKQPGYEAIIHAYMTAFLLQLLRLYNKQHPESQQKSIKPELIVRFMDLLNQNYKAHYNVEQYARNLNISAKHFIELCKTHTGKTPLQHIREFTISEAKKLLFNTQLSVKEIAYELGFDDSGNFSKYFKAATNYTPAEYREGIR